MGVLPRLAISYFAAALVFRGVVGRPDPIRLRAVLTTAGVLLAGYWALLTFVPVPGGTAGDLSPSGNLGAWIDRTVIGEAHLWRQSKTWDPEGLLSTLPAIATALTGVAAGIVLRSSRRTVDKMLLLAGAGLVGVIAGLAWGTRFPINKNLWTSSYVLLTSGLASVALAVCYWAVDGRPPGRQWCRPLIVLGTNALALFVLSGLLVKTLILIKIGAADGARVPLYAWIYQHIFAPVADPKNASLLFAITALVLLYGVLELFYRRRWFLRV
jgi:predicted acyltransferase